MTGSASVFTPRRDLVVRILFAVLFLAGFAVVLLVSDSPQRWPLAILSLFGLTTLALVRCRWLRPGARELLLVAVAARFVLAPMLPSFSDDAYRYLWDGQVQLSGENPYLYLPSELADQLGSTGAGPLYEELNSKDYYTVYPALSQLMFRASAYLSGGQDWLRQYYILKGVFILIEIAALFVLVRLASSGLAILYAWNPLVVLETAGQAHTESLMILLLALTALALKRERRGLALVAITLAGWVKLYPLMLVPFVLRRAGWRYAWVPVVVSLAVWAPYLNADVPQAMRASLDLYVRSFEFNAGPYYGLKWLFTEFSGRTGWSKTIGPTFRYLFLASLPVLYVLDLRRSWSFGYVTIAVIGLFLFFSTTIHPWYLLGILAMIPFLDRPRWSWLWLGASLLGTYLFYVPDVGPWSGYWPFIWVGWLGWATLVIRQGSPFRAALSEFQQIRSDKKAGLLEPFIGNLPGLRLLDLGCGEGYVGRSLAERGADVTLCDVADYCVVADLPFVKYDGRRLPFKANEFECVLLVYVLHHAANAEDVLKEAVRVCSGKIVILESVHETERDLVWLTHLDQLANGLRSGRAMKDQHLRFRTHEEWLHTFESLELNVVTSVKRGRFPHKQAIYVLTG